MKGIALIACTTALLLASFSSSVADCRSNEQERPLSLTHSLCVSGEVIPNDEWPAFQARLAADAAAAEARRLANPSKKAREGIPAVYMRRSAQPTPDHDAAQPSPTDDGSTEAVVVNRGGFTDVSPAQPTEQTEPQDQAPAYALFSVQPVAASPTARRALSRRLLQAASPVAAAAPAPATAVDGNGDPVPAGTDAPAPAADGSTGAEAAAGAPTTTVQTQAVDPNAAAVTPPAVDDNGNPVTTPAATAPTTPPAVDDNGNPVTTPATPAATDPNAPAAAPGVVAGQTPTPAAPQQVDVGTPAGTVAPPTSLYLDRDTLTFSFESDNSAMMQHAAPIFRFVAVGLPIMFLAVFVAYAVWSYRKAVDTRIATYGPPAGRVVEGKSVFEKEKANEAKKPKESSFFDRIKALL